LVVDADAVLSFAVTFQGLKPIPWQSRQVAQDVGRFEPVQLEASGAFDSRESFNTFSGGEVGSPLVPETHDHREIINEITLYVKGND
jgi:hypothetical protein